MIGIFNQAFLIALLVLPLTAGPSSSGERACPDRARRPLARRDARDQLLGRADLRPDHAPGRGPHLAPLPARADGGRITAVHLLIAAPVLAIALYAPYYLSFASSGIKGIGLVTAPSDPVQFLLVHGFFLAIAYLACIPDLRRRPYLVVAALPFLLGGYVAAAIAVVPLACLAARIAARDGRWRPEDLLVALGLAIALFCELVYLKDNMGDQYLPDEHGLQVLHRGLAPPGHRDLRDGRPFPRPAGGHEEGGPGAGRCPSRDRGRGARPPARGSVPCRREHHPPIPTPSTGSHSSTGGTPGTRKRSGS